MQLSLLKVFTDDDFFGTTDSAKFIKVEIFDLFPVTLVLVGHSIFCASSWLAYSPSGGGNSFTDEFCNEITVEEVYNPKPSLE